MEAGEKKNLKRKRGKFILAGLVILLSAAFFIYNTYLEKQAELVWYDRIEDETFSIFTFTAEDVTSIELSTENVAWKTTVDLQLIGTMLESISKAELLGKSRIVLDEDVLLDGSYTCYIDFALRNGDAYELRVQSVDSSPDHPQDSVFIFRCMKNGVLNGKYNSDYYGERFFFRGDVKDVFWEVYEAIL